MTENDLGVLKPEWDRVSGDPAMTAFKQAARRQQATWRANQQFEAGEQPKGQPNGSTLADEVGRGLWELPQRRHQGSRPPSGGH